MADYYESDNPFDQEPEFDPHDLPSEEQVDKELDEIEKELRQREIERIALIRKEKVANLPDYRRDGLDPKKKYRVFCVEICKSIHSTPFLFKTIALDGADALSHIEKLFKREAADLLYVKPKWASEPDYPHNLYKLMKGEKEC